MDKALIPQAKSFISSSLWVYLKEKITKQVEALQAENARRVLNPQDLMNHNAVACKIKSYEDLITMVESLCNENTYKETKAP